MKMTQKIIAILAIASSAACTTSLQSSHVKKGTPPSPATGGVYYLPQQILKVAITYELKSCDNNKADISKKASISIVNRIDGTARFEVPVSTLSSRFKTTSLTVTTFDDGTLKSLGASIDDRSAEIVGGLVNTAGSIARIASGAALNSSSVSCSTEYTRLVGRRDTLVEDLLDPTKYTAKNARENAVATLGRLNARLKITRNIGFLANPGATNPQDRVSKDFDTSPLTLARLEKWLDTSGANHNTTLSELIGTTICIRAGDDGGETIGNFHGCGADLLLKQKKNELPGDLAGLVYREPKRVRVIVCNSTCGTSTTPEIIGSKSVALAQFGTWKSIQLKSKAFQDKSVMASWSQSGRLTSLEVGESSSLEAVATTLDKSSTSIRDTLGSVVTTDAEALSADVARTKNQADLIEHQNRLNALQMAEEDINDPAENEE